MRLLFSVLLCLLISQSAYSQSIISSIRDVINFEVRGNVSKIKEVRTSFGKDTIYKELEIIILDTHQDLLSLKRYDGNKKLVFSRISSYDNNFRILESDCKQWNNLTGYQTEVSKYEYSSNGDYVQIDYDSRGKIVKQFKFYLDQNKNLVRLETFSGDGKLVGYETANYDIENNRVKILIYNARGQLLNTINAQIKVERSVNRDKSLKFNEHGDIISSDNNLYKNRKMADTFEYKYDKHNNWISQKHFLWTKSSNGELTGKTLYAYRSRTIKYFKK